MNDLSKLFPCKFCLIAIFLAGMLTACGQQKNTPTAMPASSPMSAMPAGEMAQAKMADAVAGGGEQSLTEMSEPMANASSANPEAKRYIAMRHALTVETPVKEMQAAFDATVAHCERLKCQILSANYNRETPYSPPSASISARVPPRSVEIFLSGLAKSGEILQHHRDSEDKTDQVIDTDARIKNLTEFRDNLRAMLSDKSAKFKDLIEVQRELVNTQSQLDSMSSMRKLLAQETELVAVNIDFTATQSITEHGFFSPVAQALDNAGRVMMESIAAIITFVMGILPWIIFGIPVLILARKLWAKIRTK